MKKNLPSILLTGAVLLMTASCAKQGGPCGEASPETVTLSLSVSAQDGPLSKAVTAYTEARDYEAAVNSVQLLIFGEDGAVNLHRDLGTSLTGSVSVTSGRKTVWAVVNGPDLSRVGSLSELESTALALGDNSTSVSEGFVMAGSTACTVGPENTSCTVAVSRLCARVALRSITNSLPAAYGDITVERVFLANVAGGQTLGGNSGTTAWYNRQGRMDETPQVESHVIDGKTWTASCPKLTYAGVGQTVENGATLEPSVPWLFYSFANGATAAPGGFSTSFTPQRSVLVVAATVDGALCYYPVVLSRETLERNTTYTVGLTITSVGSSDPNDPVDKGEAGITVTVDGWKAGAVYDETI